MSVTIPSISVLLTDENTDIEEKLEIIDLLLLLNTNDNVDELLDLKNKLKRK